MEKVQLALERFLPELRDLERKKVFTKDEISDIVVKRRAFEVAASKRDVKPVDYLRYIEYEVRLEKLRKVRAKRLQTTTKKTLSDHSIAAHITHLHRLSCRRFPASLALWDSSLAHSLTLSSPLLVSRTLSSAIAMHPTQVRYWIMASRWESEGDRKGMGGGNVEGARRLCMRGLRFLKAGAGEMEIWREWVRLEVAYVERVRGRWEVLGIGKKDAVGLPVPESGAMEVDEVVLGEDGEPEGPAEVDVPLFPSEETSEADATLKDVQALSGQEAILDGAIVRVVLDNCLSSFGHSLEAHQSMINLLRILPSPLRLPLLTHVYASLRSHFEPTSTSYAPATHVLATRAMYDVAFDPKVKESTVSLYIDAEAPAASEVRVQGEAFVDAVGEVVEEYWKACKGRKGKGKAKEKAPVQVWESFCSWLEELEDEAEDENLTVFLTSNLTTALSLAPSSSLLSLLHLRHLLRTTAPHPTILSFAKLLVSTFGSSLTPASIREEIWVARVETVVALGTGDEASAVFKDAEKALPWSGRIWDVQADWIERSGTEDVAAWYETSIKRVLLLDAVRAVDFQSKFDAPAPRELLPMRYISYLSTQDPLSIPDKLSELLRIAPTLPLSFLSFILDLTIPGLERAVEVRFRNAIHARIVGHPEAGAEHWVAYAGDLLRQGEVLESNKTMQVAARACVGREGTRLERLWAAVCDA